MCKDGEESNGSSLIIFFSRCTNHDVFRFWKPFHVICCFVSSLSLVGDFRMVCGAVSVCFDIGVLRLKSECKSTELHRQASTTRVQQSSESAVYCTGIQLISTYREF